MKLKRLSSVFASAVVAFSSILSVAVIPAASAVVQDCAWKGAAAADLSFTNPANWNNCNSTYPQTGDNVVLDVSTLAANTTIAVGSAVSVNDITISGTSSSSYSYDLTGSAITLTGNIANTSNTFFAIANDVVLSGNKTIAGGTNSVSLNGVVSGSGNITSTGDVYLSGVNTFTGNITHSNGSIAFSDMASAGNAANVITVNSGGDIFIGSCSDTTGTFPYALILNGVSSAPTGASVVGKFNVGALCHGGGGGGATESFGLVTPSDQTYTLSGHIDLGSNVTFGAIAKSTTITGPLTGSYLITMSGVYGGKLVIDASSNSSNSSNGTITPDPVTSTLSDNQPTNTVDVNSSAVITVDGTRGDTNVFNGGKLMGSGTVGQLSVSTGGTVAPGHSPGCLTSGNFALSGTYQAEIGGTAACTGYDQMKVTGTVTLTGGTLDTVLYNGYKPAKGESYVIIDNDGTDAVTGTFTGLAEGATFTVNGYVFTVSYVGGDGNDVVLTVQNVPATPDTGFAYITSHPIVTLAVSVMLAGSIFGIAKYNTRKVAVRTRR